VGCQHSSREGHCLVSIYRTTDIEDKEIVGGAAERQLGILDVGHVYNIQTTVTGDGRRVVDGAESLGSGQRGSEVGNILRARERRLSCGRRDQHLCNWILEVTTNIDGAVEVHYAAVGESPVVAAG
jgi:hypothetical protein